MHNFQPAKSRKNDNARFSNYTNPILLHVDAVLNQVFFCLSVVDFINICFISHYRSGLVLCLMAPYHICRFEKDY